MILSKEQISKILDIIKKRHNLFAVKTIGAEVLTDSELQELREEYGEDALNQVEDLIKDSYFVGYLRSQNLDGNLDKISHNQFKNMPRPRLGELENYSIEHAKEVTSSYLQKQSQSVQTNMENLIRKYNKMYKDFIMTNVGVPMAIIAKKEGQSISQLVTNMRDVSGDVARDWHRVAVTETMNAVNSGMADKIIEMNEGVEASKILVYKRVVNDAALCRSCRMLHLQSDGVTPKIYTLEQAFANGSNVGRKAVDWLFTISSVHPHCFDKETEVLSDRGWVLFNDLCGCEKILSVDLETHNAEWVEIDKIIKYHYKGDMTHYKHNSCDLMVSPEHHHVASTNKKKEWRLVEDKKMPKRAKLLATVNGWIGDNPSHILGFKPEDFVKFVAMFLSDGSITKKGNQFQVKIAQCDKKNLVEENLSPIFDKIWIGQEHLTCPLPKSELSDFLNGLGRTKEKHIPTIIKDLNKELLRIFLDTYVEFDGHVRESKGLKGNFRPERVYFTSSPQMASDIGEIILKVGHRPSYFLNKSKDVKFRNGTYRCSDVWTIRECRTTVVDTYSNMKVERIPYNDFIYDVELKKNHTLFVRRNGKVLLSGNCRCTLIQLPDGYWFKEDGGLEFVGTKKHNEMVDKYLIKE